MIIDLKQVIEKTSAVDEYIRNLPQPYKGKFIERKQTYQLEEDVIHKIKGLENTENLLIVVFSAEWCKDCTANVPILALLDEKANIKVRVFGGMKTDTLNPKETWRIPPSPPEAKLFNVQKIPHIMVFDDQGKQLGTIIENPRTGNTLEEEILYIIQSV